MTAGNEVFLLDKPDEARAEHGGRGGEESLPERVRGGERRGDLCNHVGRHGGWVGRYGAEEEVVVVGHGSVVEEGGVIGRAGVFEEDVLGYAILIRGTLKNISDLIQRGRMS